MSVQFFGFSDEEIAHGQSILREVRDERGIGTGALIDGAGYATVFTPSQWAAIIKDKAAIAAMKNDLLAKISQQTAQRYRPFGYNFVLRLVD